MATPDAIILDIGSYVQAFRQKLLPKDDYAEYVSEMVHSIICCFGEKERAEYDLRELVAEVEFAEHANDESPLNIPPSYAEAILDLGLAILQHVLSLDIYDEDGELQYEYYSYELPGFPDAVLKRIEK